MATLEPDDDGLITITLVRGDSDDLLVTVVDDAVPPVPVDLSKAVDGTAARPAVIRFSVKSKPDQQTNEEALVFKTSHYPDQIPFLAQAGATMGQCRVLIDKPDTETGDPAVKWKWDLEVSRQDALRSAASVGTLAFTPGSDVVVGTATQFQNARQGDVLQPLGVLNLLPVMVIEVLSATQLRTSFSGWQAEAGVTFEIRRGKNRTAARGPFTLLSGVVAT